MTESAKATVRPWKIDPISLWIMADNVPKGPMHVADVRGWGYLTGKGHALALPAEDAFAIQKANAELIVRAVNTIDAVTAERDALAARVKACEDFLRSLSGSFRRNNYRVSADAIDKFLSTKEAERG